MTNRRPISVDTDQWEASVLAAEDRPPRYTADLGETETELGCQPEPGAGDRDWRLQKTSPADTTCTVICKQKHLKHCHRLKHTKGHGWNKCEVNIHVKDFWEFFVLIQNILVTSTFGYAFINNKVYSTFGHWLHALGQVYRVFWYSPFVNLSSSKV